jgi:hypothetical protein
MTVQCVWRSIGGRMEGVEEGIKVGGKLTNDVRFTDDQGMVLDLREDYRKL